MELPSTLPVDYQKALCQSLRVIDQAGPFDLAVYLAGADPFVSDRLGRLALSKNGLQDRDRLILRWCRDQGIPLAIAMAGGYAPEIDDIVDIHAATVRLASERCGEFRPLS